jgi:glutamate-ammonia-ligase adenylyltransferase
VRLKTISKKFEKKLAEISAGAISSDDFEKLIKILEAEINRVYFTASSEANLIRIIQAMYDKVLLIQECIRYPHYAEILILVASNSNYLTDILIINPEYFYWIVNPSILNIRISETKFKKEIKSTLSLYNTLQSKNNSLKVIKKKEFLRIGLKDIYSKISLNKITEELSTIAVCLTRELFSICYKETLKKYGLQNNASKYCLVALGKLGGNELNYSSDIDLILFYDKERKFRNNKFFSEILTEASQLFLKSSSEISGGFLYRIDFRLRPDGRNSPICRSLQEYLDYYESRGEDWEKQMLIKASFVSGSKLLYKKFADYLSPFVYPSTITTSPKKQILKMKESIERRIKDEENIKLIPGGIRDIEFSVQALQLINGGKISSIRTGNTLEAIETLRQVKLLNKDEAKIFSNAYVFYRRIEHYLQLMNNRQTHIIPDEGELLKKMSSYLGFKDTSEFKQQVIKSRNEVGKIYKSILNEDDINEKDRINYEGINFDDRNRAFTDIQFLREGKGIFGNRTFDSKSINSFMQIENNFYKYLRDSSSPDKVLSNFVRIIKQVEFPSIWYNELLDNTFFTFLMMVCEFSQYSVDLFAEDNKLREFFLSRRVFMKISQEELSNLDIKTILFYISVQITVNLLELLTASILLSTLIRNKINKLFEKHTKEKNWDRDYFVAALGSLGSSTLTFYSDLDLIFITRSSQKYPDIEQQFQSLLELLRSTLKPFTADCRLRPEGKSSQLVWDIEDSKNYFQNRARVWEFQALIKISFIAGNKRLFNSFCKAATSSISRFDRRQIKREIIEMRKKISTQKITPSLEIFDVKKSSGSITDIEFIIQHLIILNSKLFNQSLGNTFAEQINLTAGKGITNRDVTILNNAFGFFKNVELLNQLIFNSSTSKIMLEKILNAFSNKMNYENPEQFKDELISHSANVRKIYSKLIS